MIKLKETDLLHCCGSTAWARQMAAHSFPNVKEVFATGDSIWWSLDPSDWKEAFAGNARVGDLPELMLLNREYLERFGFPFVIPAVGKSAQSLIEAARARLQNDLDTEIKVAAEEQRQIAHLRLKRLLLPYK